MCWGGRGRGAPAASCWPAVTSMLACWLVRHSVTLNASKTQHKSKKLLCNIVTLLLLWLTADYVVQSFTVWYEIMIKKTKTKHTLNHLTVCHDCRGATMQDTLWSWTLWSTTSTSCPVECSTRKPSPSSVRHSTSVCSPLTSVFVFPPR